MRSVGTSFDPVQVRLVSLTVAKADIPYTCRLGDYTADVNCTYLGSLSDGTALSINDALLGNGPSIICSLYGTSTMLLLNDTYSTKTGASSTLSDPFTVKLTNVPQAFTDEEFSLSAANTISLYFEKKTCLKLVPLLRI